MLRIEIKVIVRGAVAFFAARSSQINRVAGVVFGGVSQILGTGRSIAAVNGPAGFDKTPAALGVYINPAAPDEEQFEMIEVIEKPCLQKEINVVIQYPEEDENQIRYTFQDGTDIDEWYNF